MSELSYWYYPEHDLVVTKIVGNPTLEELRKFIQETARDPRLRPGLKILQDNRDASINLSYDEITSLAAFVKSVSKNIPRASAILIKNPMMFGITRQASVGFEDIGVQTHRPFYELRDALQWLGIPEVIELPIA
jgi:hypothetical protein